MLNYGLSLSKRLHETVKHGCSITRPRKSARYFGSNGGEPRLKRRGGGRTFNGGPGGCVTSVRVITAELTTEGVPTAQGGQWHLTSVKRLVDRLAG